MASHVNSSEDRDNWIRVQKKTFTRWVNQYLSKQSPIEDITTDLADGIQLANLLNAISDDKVGKINMKPKIAIQKLENLNASMKFLADHELKTVNIGSSDILNGNEKIILGLLWTIILRFEVNDAQGKAGLLLWVQRSVNGYDGVNVQNFTTSFSDGLAFNALINRYRPDVLSYDRLSSADGMENCERAFKAAENDLGIARLLDAEDVVNSPDDKSTVAYLSQFFKLFAGQAKYEAMAKAIKNAVEVTRRHDEWTTQYSNNVKEVLAYTEESTQQYKVDDSSSTEGLGQALDDFTKRMNEVKPQMQSKRAEAEATFATLVSSKRNNKRPTFAPDQGQTLEELATSWDNMETIEQQYERALLDKYMAFKQADRAVQKFSTKCATVNTWLSEKESFLETSSEGLSIQDLEAKIEMNANFQERFKLYERVQAELETMASSLQDAIALGHAGAKQCVEGLTSLNNSMATSLSKSESLATVLTNALQVEKELVQLQKQYGVQVERLDFESDALAEDLSGPLDDLTVDELKLMSAMFETMPEKLQEMDSKVNALSQLAEKVVSKITTATDKASSLSSLLDGYKTSFEERKMALSDLLTQAEEKDNLKKQFAASAKTLNEFIEVQQTDLSQVNGDLNEQLQAVKTIKSTVVNSGNPLLDTVREDTSSCISRGIVVNEYTNLTVNSLTAKFEQFVKGADRVEQSILAQSLAQQSLQISPEQLNEARDVFKAFDNDNDGVIDLKELKEAILGIGIDLSDAELAKRFPNDRVNVETFVDFFVQENKTGDTVEDVKGAFRMLSGNSVITNDVIQKYFGNQAELCHYLETNINEGDYDSFTDELFSR